MVLGGVGSRRTATAGRLLVVVIGAWAAIRAVVSITWRDPAVLGSLPAGGVLAAGIVVGAAVCLITATQWSQRRTRTGAAGDEGDGPSWPDPETRPQF
jgi:hypothetical protein